MISFLEGTLEESLPTRITVNVNGVGYEVFIPLSTYEQLPAEGSKIRVLTHLQIREDEHVLFGFARKEERDLFRLLVSNVSGVGPKVALSVLSGCSPEQFQTAVIQNDTGFLSKIKGLGKKTAERVIVELKDRVGVSKAWEAASPSASAGLSPEQQRENDALLALIALGYKQQDATKALTAAPKNGSVEDLVREALKRI